MTCSPGGTLSLHGIDVKVFILSRKTLTGSAVPVAGVTRVEREKQRPRSSGLQGIPPGLLPQPAATPAPSWGHVKPRAKADTNSRWPFTFQQQGLAVYFCRQEQSTLGSRG